MIKNIFARIWALWGLVTFITTFLIIYIPSMLCWLIPEPAGQKIFIAISRLWMNVWLIMVGCPLKVSGRKYFEKGKSYIVTSNHNSFLDIPLSCPFIPGANKTIAKKSFTKIPLFGFFYMKGSVLVDRNSDASRRKSFEDMKGVLKKGMHMGIYPEGTRNRSQEPLKPFYDGAFKLAVATNTAIIPAIIFNTKKALPTTKPFYFLPTKLRMDFLPPVSVLENEKASELKNRVFNIMKNYYVENK